MLYPLSYGGVPRYLNERTGIALKGGLARTVRERGASARALAPHGPARMRTDHDSAPIRPRATAVGRDERWAHRPCRASGKQRTPGRTRTRDPLLRRQPLYPSELQGHMD